MAEKRNVTVSLTAKQKEQIKRATGKSISALKVSKTGGLMAARIGTIARLAKPAVAARVSVAKQLARVSVAKTMLARKMVE